jgi:hypothetical protein
LSLNIKKTHYIVFKSSNRKHVQCTTPLKLQNQTISQVHQTIFLGVLIDESLRWTDHINYVRSKIAKGFGVICRAKHKLNTNILVSLYYSFIYPYLEYCIEVWGNTFQCHLDSLVKLQKKIIRCITRSNFKAHTEPLFKELSILQLSNIYKYRVSLFMYKYCNNILPIAFHNMFTPYNNVHNTRSSNIFYIKKC